MRAHDLAVEIGETRKKLPAAGQTALRLEFDAVDALVARQNIQQRIIRIGLARIVFIGAE